MTNCEYIPMDDVSLAYSYCDKRYAYLVIGNTKQNPKRKQSSYRATLVYKRIPKEVLFNG